MSRITPRWVPVIAVPVIAAGSQLSPALACADLHNVTYRARIDGVAPGSLATFLIQGGQTSSAPLSTMPGQTFQANEVLDIDVDNNVATQVDKVVSPHQGDSDPSAGVLGCGAPLPR